MIAYELNLWYSNKWEMGHIESRVKKNSFIRILSIFVLGFLIKSKVLHSYNNIQ